LNPAHLLKAIAFAAEKHRHQTRKDAEESPYIIHPIAVATVLAVEADVADEASIIYIEVFSKRRERISIFISAFTTSLLSCGHLPAFLDLAILQLYKAACICPLGQPSRLSSR
jgi:hypothetical protein